MPTSPSPSSGSTGKNGKFCTVCNDDVSAKPRTKDAKGRYFCQPCYQQAVAKRRDKREGMSLPKAPPARGEAALNPDDDGPSVLEQLLDLEPSHAAPALICPSCRSQIPQGGFICVTCGFNVQTNEQASGVRVKTQRKPGGGAWPLIVGIISMIFGGAGAIIYGLYFIIMFLAASKAEAIGQALVTVLPIGSLFTALGLWLFRDGLRIVRHDAEGVKWIRYWAMAKILLYGSCLGLFMSIPPGAIEEGLSRTNSQLTVADIKSSMLMIMGWLLLWPIFVMVFFFVPRIQEDVESW